MNLKTLRASLREKRLALSPAQRAEKSLAIAKRVQGLAAWRRARNIALYWPTPEEVDTASLIQMAQAESRHCFLPVINHASWRGQPLLFRPFVPDATPLKNNRYGIAEPIGRSGAGLRGQDMDLVITPVVGFNQQCDRIGMGGGFYDRTFQGRSGQGGRWRATLIGIAFDCQLADFDPAPHDIPLNGVVTETRRY